ncbi:MAG: DNA adenine methylase [Gammaproteobacteria bacterium]|nr:MAG: DNA adenine methylase [Gammaproteobacteria bacterium]
MSVHFDSKQAKQTTLARGQAKPFLKWAGGKQQLLKQFERLFPSQFNRYIEPFLGGGAVYFYLWNRGQIQSDHSLLFDINEELINTYRVVRDQLDLLIELLEEHARQHCREYYYSVRALDRKPNFFMSDVERAARTIYLNKTCFNGLYRVNRKGEFNVPMGSYKNPQIFQEATLKAASDALQGTLLDVRDFRSVTAIARPGDFVYFDPPYVPLSATANFTSYTSSNFDQEDQHALASVFQELTERGCYCMLSNSYTPLVLELYEEFRIEVLLANRAINSKGNSRGLIREVVVLNY